MRTTPELSRRTNAALLFAAYGLGQGSLFAVQTYLVLRGELSFVGNFGLAFTLATLAFTIVDWGGLALLARHELAQGREGGDAAHFWSLCAVRLVLALAGAGALLVWPLLGGRGFLASYAVAAAPALLFAAINPGGVLDGLHRSGLTGLTTMVPILLSAAALVVAPAFDAADQPLILGGAYSLGIAASVLLQFVLIARAGRSLRFAAPRAALVRSAARQGGFYILMSLPSHAFYRAQVAISMALLGGAATGLFIYAKQVSNAIIQGTALVLRAEFPNLIRRLRTDNRIRGALRAQAGGIAFGSGAGIALSAAGIACWWLLRGDIADAALLAAAFGPTILLSSYYNGLTQACVAAGRTGGAAIVANATVAAAVIVSVLLVDRLGLVGFPLVELAMNVMGFTALCWLWRKHRHTERPPEEAFRSSEPPELPLQSEACM